MPVPTAQYPVNLVIEGRPCLVVGGGPIAARKVAGLLACGAVVTVIAPRVATEIEAWAAEGRVTLDRRPYRRGEVAGYRLVIAATDVPTSTRPSSSTARTAGVWVNAADDPASCSFTLPAVVRRGPLMVTVATGGHSPALARWLRHHVEVEMGDEYRGAGGVAVGRKGTDQGIRVVPPKSSIGSKRSTQTCLSSSEPVRSARQGSASRRVCHRRRTQPPHRPTRVARAGDGIARPAGQGAGRPGWTGLPGRGGDPVDLHADRGLRRRRPLPSGRPGHPQLPVRARFSAPEDRRRPPQILYDDAAIGHLFTVAAGLDSAVLGESEILGQVRAAPGSGPRRGRRRAVLSGLFRHALEVGKRVRSETAIARGTTSVSQAAVALAAAPARGCDSRAGGSSSSARGDGRGDGRRPGAVAWAWPRSLVANRTPSRARALADRGSAVGRVERRGPGRRRLSGGRRAPDLDRRLRAAAHRRRPDPGAVAARRSPAADRRRRRAPRRRPGGPGTSRRDHARSRRSAGLRPGRPATSAAGRSPASTAIIDEEVAVPHQRRCRRPSRLPPTISDLRSPGRGRSAPPSSSASGRGSPASTDASARRSRPLTRGMSPSSCTSRRCELKDAAGTARGRAAGRRLAHPVRSRQLSARVRVGGRDRCPASEPKRSGGETSRPAAAAGRDPGQPPRPLAADLVCALLARVGADGADVRRAGQPVDLVVIDTTGDRRADIPISAMGGQGVFVKEVQSGGARGPGRRRRPLGQGPALGHRSRALVLAAVPARDDPRDALVGSGPGPAAQPGGRVATGSVRRRAQLANAAARPDLRRAAGQHRHPAGQGRRLRRHGHGRRRPPAARAWPDRITEALDPELLVPQVGQGALAVECRAEDVALTGAPGRIDDPPSRSRWTAERAFLAQLGRRLHLPVGAHAAVDEPEPAG